MKEVGKETPRSFLKSFFQPFKLKFPCHLSEFLFCPIFLYLKNQICACFLSEYICTAGVVCVKYEIFCFDLVHGLFGSMYTWQVFLSFQTLNCLVSVDCKFQMSILLNLRGLSKLAKGFTKLEITKSALTSSPLH